MHEIVADKLTHDESIELEKECIAKYQTNNSHYGYNLTEGGEGCKASEATKQTMSNNRQGRNAHGYGHEMPDFAKRIVSQKLTGIHRSQESKQKMSKKKKEFLREHARKVSERLIAEYTTEYRC